MRLTFDDPAWLLGLLLVPVVVVLGLRAVARVRQRQHRVATGLRAAAVGLLALALAGPRWQAIGGGVDVALLVDASDSVGSAFEDALDWVDRAIAAMPDGDRAALALFGADARLEYTLRRDPPRSRPATLIDPSASDLAQALRLAQGALGSQHRRRAVLLTDGRQTRGDAVRAAEELASAGVHVDVVRLAGGLAADVLVEEVAAPGRVREGETFDVVATLHNTGDRAADVVVVVTADGEQVHRATVTARPGTTDVTVPQTADRAGPRGGLQGGSDGPRTVRYEARLSSGASTIAQNDIGRAAVQVEGRAKVLVLEDEPGLGQQLEAALDSSGIPTDRADAGAGVPPLDRLLDHQAVVLVDVPADRLAAAGQRTLDAYVRDAGRGLVAVGGDSSYGMGDYDGTPLEELLPVYARVKDPERRPSVAEALVVDVSGSMAACHCQDGGFGGGGPLGGMQPAEGGVNKTDISKEAIARAVAALEAEDTVGVLAFNTESEWVIPLQKLPSDAVVDRGLARLHPEGGTSVPQAIREAIAGLVDVDARLRHIVLFSDGFTEDRALVEVAREAAAQGITVSVVGTGEGSGEVLREMAAAGGGRYYPGRDLFSIPDIIVNEVQFVARPIVNEGRFVPVVTGLAPVTEQLDRSPPLLGYLATTAKPTATTLLSIGDERDPLLATWRAGLGTAVAWTSDASPRWSAQWVTWERFARFWSDVVKSTFPAEPDARFSLSATAATDRIGVRLEAAEALPADVEALATVTAPDGRRTEVPLERTGLQDFEGSVPGGAEGVYAASVRLRAGGGRGEVLFADAVTATRSYSPEYASGEADAGLLDRIVAAGHGRLDPQPSSAFEPVGLPAGADSRPLWSWLALLALLLLPADVGLRRLRLEREDWYRARAFLRHRRWRRSRRVAERTASTEELFVAKRRAREPHPPPDATAGHGPPPAPRGGRGPPPAPSAATPPGGDVG
ncbi:MAG TPA: VWA domain-containing protein, partial [Nitriliruptorales bacterium]|nr:VWA domain-containing protein [Nitriliruptorales bacterium]